MEKKRKAKDMFRMIIMATIHSKIKRVHYKLHFCVRPTKIHTLKPNLQCDGIKKWWL